MKVKNLHNWDLSYQDAGKLQEKLAERIRFTRLRRDPQLVAGIDCAFSKDKKKIFASVVVLKLPEFDLVEDQYVTLPVRIPYIPGLLSFREAPACIEAVRKLRTNPEVFLIDGQGIAHPRRLGLASHLGLFFDKPTIGCAKSRLTGEYKPPAKAKGSHTPLIDNSEIIGEVLRTRTNVKPLFISVGHKCRLNDALELTLKCTTKFRIPEPTRLADRLVTRFKQNPR